MGSICRLKRYLILTCNRLYYQENPKRLPVCTLPIHTLLHIADCIEGWGPVWCYWSYPMEQFCGHLKNGGAASKRFPYKSLDNYVFDWTTLWHLGAVYNIRDRLQLKKPRKASSSDSRLEVPGCESEQIRMISLTYTTIQTTDASSWHDSRWLWTPLQISFCSCWDISWGGSLDTRPTPPSHGEFRTP